MLPPSDRAVCERDTALPGLATVLDGDALRRLVGRPDLSPVYLRYKPGTSCVAGLAPADGDPAGAIVAMAYPPGRRYREVRERPSWQIGPDPVRFHDDLCLALVPLSRDRRLKAARPLAELELAAAVLGRGASLPVTALRLLRYKPGRRLVLRLDGEGGPLAVWKAYAEDDFARARLAAEGAAARGGVPLLAVEERQRVLVLGWIKGRPLCPTPSEPPDPEAVRATGRVLRRLHAGTLLPPHRLDRVAEAGKAREAADALALLRPELAEAAYRLAGAVGERLLGASWTPAPIHGDFTADQVILRDGEPVVLDWDRAATGDPARDLGAFLARLDVQALDGDLRTEEAEVAGEALLQGYAEAGDLPGAIGPERARALLALATEGFRERRPDWPTRAEAILRRAEAALASRGGRSWEETPGLREALDAGIMRSPLARALGLRLEAAGRLDVQLLRHKPGRRALVRYEVAPPPEGRPAVLLGKLRAKGLDRRTPALHAALRAAGLDGRPPHRVGVPAPFGGVEAPPLWFQEALPGRALTDRLRPGEGVAEAARAGRALALLHAAPVEPARAWSMADEMAVLERALAAARGRHPRLSAAIDAVAEAARARASGLGEGEVAGLHRDFYPDQVLIDGERTWLLDLDLHARGDAAIDLGNFVAHLRELGLREHGDAGALDPQVEAFLCGYETERGATDRARVEALAWISLARHIHLSEAVPGRSHTTEALIALCTEALSARRARVRRPA